MKLIVFLFSQLLVFSLSYAMEKAIITFQKGKVEILDASGSVLKLKTGEEIPKNSKINTFSGSRLEFIYNNLPYLIKENQRVVLDDTISTKGLFKIKNSPAFVTGVRGLYEPLWVQLVEDSEVSFQKYIKDNKGTTKDYKGWNAILDKAFQRLIKSSGNEPFSYKYSIIPNDNFNAAAFPGGQFILHTNTLDVLDAKVKDVLLDKNNKLSKDILRENFIAPILAHELAHYFNKHAYKAIKRVIGQQNEKQDVFLEVKNIRYDQEDELDADVSGSIYLQKADYDTAYMIDMLMLLKKIHSNYQETTTDPNGLNPYFSSHPSPNERLSKFPGDKQTLYKQLSELEIAFANIQLGGNLKNSLKQVDTALKNYPNNTELLKAKAICIHKMWLDTVTLEDRQLRSILDMPSFKDSMLVSKDASKSVEDKLPGDPELFESAKEAYQKIIGKTEEPSFISNYSTLIVYSKKERDRAIILAELANVVNRIQTANNLAVVYFLADRKSESLNILRTLLSNVETELKLESNAHTSENSDHFSVQKMKRTLNIRRSFDSGYLPETTTVLLNYILVSYNQDKKELLPVGENYLSNFDSESMWARYLKEKLGLKTELQPLSIDLDIQGIKINDTKEKLLQIWGNPSSSTSFQTVDEQYKNHNCEEMSYLDNYAKVILCSNLVWEVQIYKPSTFKTNNRIKIGINSKTIEGFIGNKYQKQGGYRNYHLQNKTILSVNFYNDELVEIHWVKK